MRRTATRISEPASGTRIPLILATCAALVAALAACGTSAGTGGRSGSKANGSASGYPLTVTNCGVTTTYRHPPQRVVTMNQHVTEIMLALGLSDRMVGTAYAGDSDHILPRLRDEYRDIPVLAERYPSYEVLLKAAPDFVYGGYSSAFSKQEGRSRQRLAEAGIKTYLNIGSCADGPVTMGMLWKELRTIGRIFDVEQRAEELIGKLKNELATTERELGDVEPVSVFIYDSGSKAPMTAGGHGIANEIVELAGGHNVFGGLEKSFVDVSWEQVIKRSPEVIVILDYGDTSVAEKKRILLSKPALADIPAVRNKRFAVLPLTSAVLGIRAPHAVTELAKALHPGRFR